MFHLPFFTLEIPAIYAKDLCNALEIMLTSLTAFVVSDTPYASLWVYKDFKGIGIQLRSSVNDVPSVWKDLSMFLTCASWRYCGRHAHCLAKMWPLLGFQSFCSVQKMLCHASLSGSCEVSALLMLQPVKWWERGQLCGVLPSTATGMHRRRDFKYNPYPILLLPDPIVRALREVIVLNGADPPHLGHTPLPGTPFKLKASVFSWAVLLVNLPSGWALVLCCRCLLAWMDTLSVHHGVFLGLYLALFSGWTFGPYCSLASVSVYITVSICSELDSLVGPWIWCTTCLVLNYWWALLPPPGSSHCIWTLWDSVPLLRAWSRLGGCPYLGEQPSLPPDAGCTEVSAPMISHPLLPGVHVLTKALSLPTFLRDVYHKPGPLCLTSQTISTTVRGDKSLRSQHMVSLFLPGIATSSYKTSMKMSLALESMPLDRRTQQPAWLFLFCQVTLFRYPLHGVLFFAICGWGGGAGCGGDFWSFILICGDVSNWHVSVGIRGKNEIRFFKPLQLLRDGCFNFESLHARWGYYPGKLDFQIWQWGKKGDAQKIEGI